MLQKNWQDLIKPTKLQIESGRDKDRIATLVAEPLERGFGMTLGNALRRVLLSSLQGAAINSVHIDGVLHEFSSIPGVREDVTNIILNIKDIALRVHSDGVKRMVLKKEGRGVAKAGDIEASSDVEILNPDHVICTITGSGRFTLLPAGGGTAFTWNEELRFPWWMGGPLAAVVAKPILSAIWRGNLRRLRAHCEEAARDV